MLDDFLEEQIVAVKTLKNSIIKERIVHAYLFETNGYNKSQKLIYAFIKSLLCPNKFFSYSSCDKCSICNLIDNKNYPEIKVINPDGMWIKKEQLDELQQEFSKKAIIGNKKIYIINEAEKMNTATSNSILKFLEEPAPNIIAILVTNNIYQLLDTIISRCQVISLKQNIKSTNSPLEIIADNLFNDTSKKESFINNEETLNIINNVKKFIEYYENNHLDILLYTQKLWFNYFKDKEQNILAYDIMILYYRDILNQKIGHSLMIFKEDYDNILKITLKNSEYDIVKKILSILNTKQKIKNNINLNLLLDNLIMTLEGR